MAVFPTIDNIASALSFLLTTLATLRAASRFEQRLRNNGSIGLMEGPPILGPAVTQPRADVTTDPSVLVDEDGRREGANEKDIGQSAMEASPLWDHTEAFRRAIMLGLLSNGDDADDDTSNIMFSDITWNYEGKHINVRGRSEEEDLAIAAAVEAGLVVPSSARGGGAYAQKRKDEDRHIPRNPLGSMMLWLVRELSAPLAAVPAWHGVLCSYLRKQKELKFKESEWCLLTTWQKLHFLVRGHSGHNVYNPVGLDFDASVSAAAQIPCNDASGVRGVDSSTTNNSVLVKAFAPKTFRDLRTNCFRMKERDYAQSILGAFGATGEERPEASMTLTDADSCNDDDSTMLHVLQEMNKSRSQQKMQLLPYISFQSNSKGAARVGTFFFFTADGAFMVKTVKKEEANAFLEMLPEYHRFMSDGVNKRNSLLTRIFGMYSVHFPSDVAAQSSANTGGRWDGGLFSSSEDSASHSAEEERIYLVMHSVFPSEASTFVTERFDLKGSTVGRECSPEERRTKGANAVLKDLDLSRDIEKYKEASTSHNERKASSYGICVGKRRKTALMAQLERDVDLLHRCNVLDYSLLVGVANMEQPNGSVRTTTWNKRGVPKYVEKFFRWIDFPMPYYGAGMTKVDGGALSSFPGRRNNERVTYYMGVIDFLQPWTVKKRLERDLKGLAGFDKAAISCAAPADYAARFLKFINSHVT